MSSRVHKIGRWALPLFGLHIFGMQLFGIQSFRLRDFVRVAWRRGSRFLLGLRVAGAARPNPPAAADRTTRGLVVCMSVFEDQDKTNGQFDSQFFRRFPLEIRRMVYDEVMPSEKQLWIRAVPTTSGSGGGDKATASFKKGGLVPQEHFEHYPAEASALRLLYARAAWYGYHGGHGRTFWECIDREDLMSFIRWESVALMLSCKKIYLEMFPLWTFCFDSSDDLEAFGVCVSALGYGLPPIRSIHVAPVLPPCFYFHPWDEHRATEVLPLDLVFTHDPWDDVHGIIEAVDDDVILPSALPVSQQREATHRPPCGRHAIQWDAYIHRLNEAIRHFSGLATLTLNLVPVGDSHATVSDPPALVESLRLIEGAPLIMAEAPWRHVLAGYEHDVPHPSGRLRVRRPG